MKRFKKRSAKMNATHYSVLVRRQFRQILSNVKLFASLLLQAPIMLIISLLVYNKDTENRQREEGYENINTRKKCYKVYAGSCRP